MRTAALTALLLATLASPTLAGPVEALTAALNNPDVSTLDRTLSAGLDPNTRFGDGSTPLLIAATTGRLDQVRVILAHHGDPNEAGAASLGGMTPLDAAAGVGAVSVIEVLLDGGAAVDGRDSQGATPLDYAAGRGQSKVAALLLARGAAINAVNAYGMTPLHFAASSGDLPTVRVLLAMGASADARDAAGRRPVDLVNTSAGGDAVSRAGLAAALGTADQRPQPAPVAPNTASPPTNCFEAMEYYGRRIAAANPGVKPSVLYGALEMQMKMVGCGIPPAR